MKNVQKKTGLKKHSNPICAPTKPTDNFFPFFFWSESAAALYTLLQVDSTIQLIIRVSNKHISTTIN